MSYFNYHAKAKQLINEGHLTDCKITSRWNSISPALVLYFDNNKPMPIRSYRWIEYNEALKTDIESTYQEMICRGEIEICLENK